MIERSLPRTVFERAPLLYFIAQVRFGAVLQMRDHVPSIQEALRKAGYPVFGHAIQHTITIDSGRPSVQEVDLFNFVSADNASGVILTTDFVGYHTVKYETFDVELPRIAEAIRIVDDVADLGVIERCGLRYVDVVCPEPPKDLSSYLTPSALGWQSEEFGVKPEVFTSMFQGQSERGTLVVKFATGRAPGVMPPDLAPPALDIPVERWPAGAEIGTLDFDHFVQMREKFDVEKATETLGDLHDAIARAFNRAITQTARELWGEHDVTA